MVEGWSKGGRRVVEGWSKSGRRVVEWRSKGGRRVDGRKNGFMVKGGYIIIFTNQNGSIIILG